jgi:uncharacterized membrane protein YwzB
MPFFCSDECISMDTMFRNCTESQIEKMYIVLTIFIGKSVSNRSCYLLHCIILFW